MTKKYSSFKYMTSFQAIHLFLGIWVIFKYSTIINSNNAEQHAHTIFSIGVLCHLHILLQSSIFCSCASSTFNVTLDIFILFPQRLDYNKFALTVNSNPFILLHCQHALFLLFNIEHFHCTRLYNIALLNYYCLKIRDLHFPQVQKCHMYVFTREVIFIFSSFYEIIYICVKFCEYCMYTG